MAEKEESEIEHPPILQTKRVFINRVDSYQGRNIARYLAQCVVGATEEEGTEEEQDEQKDSDEEEEEKRFEKKPGTYEIVGTLGGAQTEQKLEFVQQIIKYETKDELYAELMQCDIIIYDITEDAAQIEEAVWAVSQLHSDIEKIEKKKPKMFILISTVLTWAKSAVNTEDPEIPFTEDDYRRRRPHADFKEHISAEKLVTKLGKTSKSKLGTYVIASGLTYGAGENIFHYLFKAAWHNAPELTCYGKGNNIVPTIHIQDLAAVVQNIMDSRPKVRYIVAVDDSTNTLKEITKAVSEALTTGKVNRIPTADALLDRELKQRDLSMLTVSLRMSAVYAKEAMTIHWVAESGLVDNIDAIVNDYRTTRGLQPMRLMVVGPPASGKTTVVQQLCTHFKLHHIKIKDVIEEAIDKRTKYLEHRRELDTRQPQEKVKDADAEEEEDEEEEEEEEEDDAGRSQEYETFLEEVEESRKENGGRLDDSLIVIVMREKLQSKPCQNQGFIIDGFPRTTPGLYIDLAKEIFANEEEGENEDGAPARLQYDRALMPELVVALDAPDAFLRERVINLPESAVVGTHNTEEGLTRRVAHYRAANADEATVLNYFDELEIHPEHIDITTDTSLKMKDTVARIIALIKGGPRNYGPTEEERKATLRVETEAKLKRDEEARVEREAQEAEEALLKKKRQEDWSSRLAEVKREERELLEAQADPLRNYLMRNVMPTLTQGLIECCKVRPDDAIDYLAEYLFKHNPQID